jgi:hypothetical protein
MTISLIYLFKNKEYLILFSKSPYPESGKGKGYLLFTVSGKPLFYFSLLLETDFEFSPFPHREGG